MPTVSLSLQDTVAARPVNYLLSSELLGACVCVWLRLLYSYAAYLVHIHNSSCGFTALTQSQMVFTGGRDFVWTAKNEANMATTGLHGKSFCESFCESSAKVVSCSSAAQFGETV